MAKTLNEIAGGEWSINDDHIPCRAGKNTRICVLGVSGQLILASDDLEDELRDWLKSRDWARLVFARGRMCSFSFDADYLRTVARTVGAIPATRRATA